MKLELPEVTSKYYAKQFLEAMFNHPRFISIELLVDDDVKEIFMAGEVLDILFEDSDNG